MAVETPITLGLTLVGYVGATAVGGVIEGVAGNSFLGSFSKLRESLKKYKPDGNHEIQEAVLRSYLQATLQVCVVYGEGLGISANVCVLKELLPRFLAKAEVITRKFANPTFSHANIDESLFRKQYRELPNDIKTKAQRVGNTIYSKVFGESSQTLGLLETPLENSPDEKKWLQKAVEEYTEFLTRLSQSKLEFPEIRENPELNELLSEKGLLMQAGDAKEREQIIRVKVLQRVEQELENKFGKLPPDFRLFFLDNWFNYFCGCFHYQLARNAGLARKFQSKLLSDIEADTNKIINVFEKFSGEFGERLKGIEENLAWLEDKQEQGFDEIKQLLFLMMPLVAAIEGDVLRKAVVVELRSEFEHIIVVVERTAKETQDVVTDCGRRNLSAIAELKEILLADEKLTPEEREAEKKALVEEYLRTQIKKLAASEIVGDVYASDKFFVNREEEQRDLPEWLTKNERIVVIKGISGNGKTALMTEVLRKIAPDDVIINLAVKGILTFYFRDLKGELIDVNLLEICKKVDARLAKAEKFFGFGSQYEEFKKVNPLDIPIEIIEKLSQALNALGDVWIVFDNFESALENQKIKDKEIEYFIRYALATQTHLRFLITAQVVPHIPDVQNIKLCSLGDLPPNYAKDFLLKKGEELKTNEVDCGLAEATDEQFDRLFDKLLPSPIALVSFVSYLKTLCETDGKVFADVLADDSLFVAYQNFDADDRNKGARIFIKRQFQLLSELEQLILRALSIFPQAIEFPVLQSILPLTLEKETLLSMLKGNSLVRKVGNNRYELLTLPKEVICTLSDDSAFSREFFHLKAATFYYSIGKPIKQCYTREDFAPHFSAIDHFTEAESYVAALYLFNEDLIRLCLLGYMNEIISRSRLLVGKLGEPGIEADNFIYLGLSLYSLGKLEEAIIEYDKAIKIFERLVNELKQDQFANDLAMAYMNKGSAIQAGGKLEEAIIEYDKAIVIRERLVNELKQNQFANDLVSTYLNKGVVIAQLGKLEEAIIEYNKVIEIRERLVNELKQDQFADDLATAYLNKGNALALLGKLEEAIIEYNKAITIRERLINELKQNQFANDLAAAYMNKGNALYILGELEEAIIEYDKAIITRERLVNELKQDQFANDLAMAYMNKGNAIQAGGEFHEAIIEYNKAIVIRERLVNELKQDQFANDLAMALMNRGIALEQVERNDEAIESYNNSEKVRELCLQRNENQVLPEFVKNIRSRIHVLIKLEDWQNVGVDVGKALMLSLAFLQGEELSEHFKNLVRLEINWIIRYLKEVSPTNRDKVYANLGKFAEVVKVLVEQD